MKPFIAILLSTLSTTSWAAPNAELWPFWNRSATTQSLTVSHQAWQQLLDRYLMMQGENTLFDYAAVTHADQQSLSRYIQGLSTLDPRQLTKSQQYAYWVNLYNALTVQLILENYPISSIKKLGGWLSFGPWDQELLTIQGQNISLNDIEHRILRPIWRDPRTHYAVNCASLGCPNLQTEAFTAHNSEHLLERAAHTFINSNKGAQQREDQWVISSIYDWFSDDFGSKRALIQHLATYRPELKDYQGELRYEYNWQLNDKKR
ncbi:DUF547 domain-containing protein [Vibrio furnissii]|uniref:DUF547 domain-containing protein n=1 Tax=Vibrio furnissii TaxID=29494 RepID=UPI0012ADFD20|nr:DUF547 domain-containing protein [Vibrio furnissii]